MTKIRYTHERVARVIITRLSKTEGHLYFLVKSAKRDEWEFPGGKLKRGETHEAAAIRELAEETGLRLVSARLHSIIRHDIVSVSGDITTRTVKRYFMAKRVERWKRLLTESTETTAVGWFTAAAALALTTESGRPLLKHETRFVIEELAKRTSETLTITHTTSYKPHS